MQSKFVIGQFWLNCRKYYSRLLWFCIAALCDWLKNLMPPSQPIRSKTKINYYSLTHTSLHFASATCFYGICLSFHWMTRMSVFFVIGQCGHFGFGLTTVSSLFSRDVINILKCKIAEPLSFQLSLVIEHSRYISFWRFSGR